MKIHPLKSAFAALIFMIFLFPAAARAADGDGIPIKFEKAGGGQFIYCNNPEFVTEDDLSTDENPTPTYLMKNEDLKPDNYSVFFCQYNATDYDLEPDIQFVGNDDCTVTITAIGYCIPIGYDHFDCIRAWADYKGFSIRTISGLAHDVPYTEIDLPVTFKASEAGEWISEYIYNYSTVAPQLTFNMLVDFTINSGECDVNFAMLKSYDDLGDRSHHVDSADPGKYYNDTSIKGIDTETLPTVEAELEIVIDSDTPNGEEIPVTVYNQFYNDGNTVDHWMTNINPNRDSYTYSRYVSTASDMLTFTYEDDSKLGYYGSAAPDKDNIWHFDIYHYNTAAYQKGMPWDKDTYVPNAYSGDTFNANDVKNTDYEFNLGNFGVTDRYYLTITNKDNIPRSLNYIIEASLSSCIVSVYDKNGNMLNPYTLTQTNPYALCKGNNQSKVEDCMFSALLQPGETEEYILEVTLPTNCYGGFVNILRADTYEYLEDEEITEFQTYDTYDTYRDAFWNGEEYMCAVNSKLYAYTEKGWEEADLPDIFSGRVNEMQLVKIDSGYAARFSGWDEYGWNISNLNHESTLYILDDDLNLTDEIDLKSYIQNMVYANGRLYIDADTHYIYRNGRLTETDDDLPVSNGETAIYKREDGYYVNDEYKIDFEDSVPSAIYASGNLFYCVKSLKNYDTDLTTGNVIGVSADGINWSDVYLPNRILRFEKADRYGGKINIHCRYGLFEFDDSILDAEVKVLLNGEYLSFIEPAKIINDRTMVPVRFIFEKLDAEVEWDGGKITVTDGSTVINLEIGSSSAYVNGEEYELDSPPVIVNDKTLIPIRFLTENLGFDVDWEQETQTAVINKKTGKAQELTYALPELNYN